MIKIVCIWLLCCAMTPCISAYRLADDVDVPNQPMVDTAASDADHMSLRSVLWPKICFPSLRKRDAQQALLHLASRSARRCYPFEK